MRDALRGLVGDDGPLAFPLIELRAAPRRVPPGPPGPDGAERALPAHARHAHATGGRIFLRRPGRRAFA